MFHITMNTILTLVLENGYRIHQILKERSNAFVIESNDQLYLVDTGRHLDLALVRQAITDLQQETSKDPQWLILTHSHFDHSGNAAVLKKEFDLKIVAGKAEARFLKHGFTPLPEGTNLLADWVSDLGKQIPGKGFDYTPVKINKSITHEWYIDPSIRLILTPGHTDGSISILVNEEAALVGDVLSGLDESHIIPAYANDINELLNSWGLLLETNCQLFLPGHGNIVRRTELESEYNKFASFKSAKD